MLMFTSAIVGIGTTITKAKSIIPKSNFFICLPLFCGDIFCSPYSDKGVTFLSAESISFILLDVWDSKKLTIK
jgi:hypothetical protein